MFMKQTFVIHRRRFLQTTALGTAALASTSFPRASFGSLTKPADAPFHGLKVGITSYTLRKFTLDQAIEMTGQAGLKYISLKDVHLPMKSTTLERKEAHRKIEAAGLVLLGGGVIYLNNKEDEIRAAFEYAKDAGMPTIICAPDPAALDTVERMAKQHDIRIAIHNHGPGDNRYPSPLDVLPLVQNRDSRMGICMDLGHTVHMGQDPVAVIQKCANRLYDFHMKDLDQAAPKGSPVEVGRGVIDIVGVLKALLAIKFDYHVALEYEAKADAPMPGVLESVGYLRGALAGDSMILRLPLARLSVSV